MAFPAKKIEDIGEGEAVAGYRWQRIHAAHDRLSGRCDSDSSGESRKTSTEASTSTKATSTSTSNDVNTNNHDQVTGNQNAWAMFPPPHPLIDGFGAQFADQLPPPPTSEQQEDDRQTRMREFHDVFAGLGVYLPRDILVQVENAHYGVLVPENVQAQLATRYHHMDPMVRWKEAEDVWNAETGRIRARWPEMGRLDGWEDLEDLPAER